MQLVRVPPITSLVLLVEELRIGNIRATFRPRDKHQLRRWLRHS